MITEALHFEIPVSVMRHGLSIVVVIAAVGPYEPWIRGAMNPVLCLLALIRAS